jgi:hypothetical protein
MGHAFARIFKKKRFDPTVSICLREIVISPNNIDHLSVFTHECCIGVYKQTHPAFSQRIHYERQVVSIIVMVAQACKCFAALERERLQRNFQRCGRMIRARLKCQKVSS